MGKNARKVSLPYLDLQSTEAAYSVEESRPASMRLILNAPEIRQEKVDALRSAIAEGRYHVSNEQIAAAIYAHMVHEGRE